jgi:chitinase
MKSILLTLSVLLLFVTLSKSQNSNLVGYWHNWNDANAPYIQLDQIDSRYDIIEIAFAVPTSPSDMTMLFTPDMVTQAAFISKIQSLQGQGKKVLLSIGGANASIDLSTAINKTAFENSMTSLITTYGFDGIDIDIEHGNSILASGTIASPSNPSSQNIIDAIKQIMLNFRAIHPYKMFLTMAPETAYIQGGQSAYGGIWGGYLPLVEALRDSIDILQVQLYNSGSMFGIDGSIYTQGTADFIVAMTEAVIQGFSTAGGNYSGLAASKVAVGLPACSSAAGGGFTDTLTVKSALRYLLGSGPKPGSYTLVQSGGYPNLGGMMTWSINWDAVSTCGSAYEFASNFTNIFSAPTSATSLNLESNNFTLYPNPTSSSLQIKIDGYFEPLEHFYLLNSLGEIVLTQFIDAPNSLILLHNLPSGMYFAKYQNQIQKLIKL